MTLIKIENITKIYSNGTKALDSVSFELLPGEIVGLLGVNGSGKTTLSTILATVHPPTSGDVLYKGQSIYKNINAYRKIIGFCPQKPNLHELLTVEQNLYHSGLFFGLSTKESKIKTDAMIEQFSLQEYRKQKPEILSGGYLQRVMIARTLMHDPEFIILDEPTIGLDPCIRSKLWQIIIHLKKTILLTTHYLDEAEILSNKICVLDAGKIKLMDTVDALRKQYNNKSLNEIFIQLSEEEAL